MPWCQKQQHNAFFLYNLNKLLIISSSPITVNTNSSLTLRYNAARKSDSIVAITQTICTITIYFVQVGYDPAMIPAEPLLQTENPKYSAPALEPGTTLQA